MSKNFEINLSADQNSAQVFINNKFAFNLSQKNGLWSSAFSKDYLDPESAAEATIAAANISGIKLMADENNTQPEVKETPPVPSISRREQYNECLKTSNNIEYEIRLLIARLANLGEGSEVLDEAIAALKHVEEVSGHLGIRAFALISLPTFTQMAEKLKTCNGRIVSDNNQTPKQP